MSVVDASVVVDALVSATDQGHRARRSLSSLHAIEAPAILRAEVASALRRLTAARALAEGQALAALELSRRMRVVSYPFEPFQPRVWELRHVMTVYDAWYVAVAEELETELITSDQRIASVPDLRCLIELVS